MSRNKTKIVWGVILTIVGLMMIRSAPFLALVFMGLGIWLIFKKDKNNYNDNQEIKSSPKEPYIVDVTRTTTPFFSSSYSGYQVEQWNEVKKRLSLDSKQSFWIDHLSIPYKRRILNAEQCEDETIKLYLDIVEIVDQYLRNKKNKSLTQFVKHFEATGGYYGNILYTLECIAEAEVGNFYRNSSSLDSDFSYKLLRDHIDESIVLQVKEYLSERIKQFTPPNEATLKLFPAPSPEFLLRRKLQALLTSGNQEIFKDIPFRSNRFLDTIQTQEEVAKIYQKLLLLISQNYKTFELESNLEIFLQNFIDKKGRTWKYNWDKDKKLKICLHRIAEDIVRKAYEINSLPSIIDAQKELKRLLKKDLANLIFEKSIELSSEVAPPNEETISHFKTNRSIKQIPAEEIKVWKKIDIDPAKVGKIIEDNDKTVSKLNKYLETEQGEEQVINNVKPKASSLEDIFAEDEEVVEIKFNNLEYEFLEMFLRKNYALSNQDVDAFMKLHKQFKSSFIDSINQKFYTSFDDILIIDGEDDSQIDQNFINILTNLVHE